MKENGNGKEYILTDIPVEKCFVEKYQRETLRPWVRYLAKNFDVALLDPISVYPVGDGYAIVDGQHRWLACMEVGRSIVPAKIINRETSYEERASYFVKANKNRKSVPAESKFFAMLEAKDPDIIEINEIITRHGFKVSEKKKAKNNHITCIGSIMIIHQRHGADTLNETLKVIRGIWDGAADSLKEAPVRGTAVFVRLFKDEYNYLRLKKSLSGISAKTITDKAGGLIEAYGQKNHIHIEQTFCRVMFDYYNKGLRTRKLSNKFAHELLTREESLI